MHGEGATVGELDGAWPYRGNRKHRRMCCWCEGWLSCTGDGTLQSTQGSSGRAELALFVAQGMGLACAWAGAYWSVEEKCSWVVVGLVCGKIAWA